MSEVSVYQTERPRNVNAYQAAAILYGDWGTSKVYIIGLAFALATYGSFWLILSVSLLNILVALNYIIICRYFPNGGGVYASVRHRSEILALLGAFFLICDYIITMAISAVSAFSYIGVENPAFWAMGIIAFIGILNYFGPRHMGNLAFAITACALIVVFMLAYLAFTQIGLAWEKVTLPSGGLRLNWIQFTGVVVALSGVEAVANMTGIMKLDPGSTSENPSVIKTAAPALIAVMLEVSIFTTLFSLAVNVLPGLVVHGDDVSAPGYPNVRDAMLRYMGENLCNTLFSDPFCHIFGLIITFTFGVLLLSGVNTALIACSSLLYLMSKDNQLPSPFKNINSFGVPNLSILVATVVPIVVLIFIHDMISLANLYAIGFIGAIATNLGSTSTDSTLPLRLYERIFMFATFILIAAIEVTLFIEKPHARMFVVTTIAIGLLMRGLVQENSKKEKTSSLDCNSNTIANMKKKSVVVQTSHKAKAVRSILKLETPKSQTGIKATEFDHIHSGTILCVVSQVGKNLEFALEKSKSTNQKLYILFVRVRKTLVEQNDEFYWLEDLQACKTFDYALNYLEKPNFTFMYTITDLPALSIVDHAKALNVSSLIIDMPRRNKISQLFHGNLTTQVFQGLPQNVDLITVS